MLIAFYVTFFVSIFFLNRCYKFCHTKKTFVVHYYFYEWLSFAIYEATTHVIFQF